MCNIDTQPADVKTNASKPLGFSISSFDVGVIQIFEVDSDSNEPVQNMYVNTSLTLVSIVTYKYTYKQDIVAYGTFTNGADIQINITSFNGLAQVDFAGQNVTIPPNTVKYSVYISKWPFYSLQNSLHVILQSQPIAKQTTSGGGACANDASAPTQSDQTGNLVYLEVKEGNQTLLVQMISTVLLDGKPKNIFSQYDKVTSTVEIVVPFFFDQIVIDPNYSVLLNDYTNTGECESVQEPDADTTSILIIGTVAGAIGVVVIVAITIFIIIPKVQLHRKLRKNSLVPSESNSNL